MVSEITSKGFERATHANATKEFAKVEMEMKRLTVKDGKDIFWRERREDSGVRKMKLFRFLKKAYLELLIGVFAVFKLHFSL